MRCGRALALALVVGSTGAAYAQGRSSPSGSTGSRVDCDSADAHRTILLDPPESLLETPLPLFELSRSMSLGHPFANTPMQRRQRPSYRFGLPMLDVPIITTDDGLLLTSRGPIAVTAGTVGWMQLDLEPLQEIAGTRVLRPGAVPGLRFHLREGSTVEPGVGFLAEVRKVTSNTYEVEKFAATMQMSGRF